jgi:hypothetical protein
VRTILLSLVILVVLIGGLLFLAGRSARRFASTKHGRRSRRHPVDPTRPDPSVKPKGHRRS